MHVLENACLKVSIADKGAELCSVLDKENGEERLWWADPAIWNRHAPILFPFVGKVTEGKYRAGGREYPMKTQHGFARDLDFACLEETQNSLTQRLDATPETRAIYPFDFGLRITHSLDADDPRRLRITWTVENNGAGEMLYSIGGHPGFLMPKGARKEDCFVFFPGHDTLTYFGADSAGFALPGATHELRLEDGFTPYLPDMPDTWIFENRGIDRVGIAGPDRRPYVTLNCPGFPMLAVWANPRGPYICLEPWLGRTDDAGFTGTLAEKPGMERLGPGEERTITYSIDFHAWA